MAESYRQEKKETTANNKIDNCILKTNATENKQKKNIIREKKETTVNIA